MTGVPKGVVPVTQADRLIAWEHRPHAYCADAYDPWMAGRYDNIRVIQDFARHRLAALADQRDERSGVGLRRALHTIADYGSVDDRPDYLKGAMRHMQVIARAALDASSAPECGVTAWPDPVLVEREVDDDCGCPEEIWEAYGAHLFMHLRPGGQSDGHADYGDEGEREMTTTGATHDDARAAIFGWARGIAAGLPSSLLAARPSLSGDRT